MSGKNANGDLAYFYLNRKKIRCGQWGTPEAFELYQQKVKEFDRPQQIPVTKKEVITINVLVDAFSEKVKGLYPRRWEDGKSGFEKRHEIAIAHVVNLYGTLPVNEFGPDKLLVVLENMVASGKLNRATINERLNLIKKIFEWGVLRKLFDGDDYLKLLTVKPLKEGETGVRESEPRPSVPTLNDLNNGLYEFFSVLADERLFRKFRRVVEALPYSCRMFTEFKQTQFTERDIVAWAARWFYVTRQSLAGGRRNWGYNVACRKRHAWR